MKAYVLTTGTIFGLITLAHVLRIVVEWPRPATDPWFVLLTIVTAGLCLWAWRLFRSAATA